MHFGLQHDGVGSFGPARFGPPHPHRTEDELTVQDAARFEVEGELIQSRCTESGGCGKDRAARPGAADI